MSTTEERVRAAAEATAASVRQIRPLALPDHGAVPAELRDERSPGADRKSGILTTLRETWLVPLGAAAAVAALALTLVMLRHAEGPRPAPAAAGPAGIPRYYAIATEGPVNHHASAIQVIVGDVRTGKTLATVALPGLGQTAVGVSVTGDDRAFVVGRRNDWGNVDYFLVRIAPGEKQVATVKRLPIPVTFPGVLLGFAVSPDGRQLAALSVRGNGTTLRIYSVNSGATLRTWIAGTWHNQSGWNQHPGVSWTADSGSVAFSTMVTTGQNQGVLVERRIGATAASGDLAAASTVLLKAPGNCSSLLLTPDGGTVVCATTDYPLPVPAAPPARCGGKYGPLFVAYSAATGKRLRVLYRYTGACERAVYTVLWSDNAARHVIGEALTFFGGNPPRNTDRFGVAAAGKFVKFPVAKHGQYYTGPAF